MLGVIFIYWQILAQIAEHARRVETGVAHVLRGYAHHLCGAEGTPITLVVSEDEDLILDDGSAHCTVEYVDLEWCSSGQTGIDEFRVAGSAPVGTPEVKYTAMPSIATRPGLNGNDSR